MCVCVNVFAFLNEAFSSKTGWRSHLTKTFGDKRGGEGGVGENGKCLIFLLSCVQSYTSTISSIS